MSDLEAGKASVPIGRMTMKRFLRCPWIRSDGAHESNLRQIGVALNLYVSDFQKHPLWLNQTDLGARVSLAIWDTELLPLVVSNRNVFVCLANKDPHNSWTNGTRIIQPNSNYGYNMSGTARYLSRPSFGLDGGTDSKGEAVPLAESAVRSF